MDYKVADLRKKLNKLKYSTGTKTDRIARLMKDYEKVVNMNAEIVSFLRGVHSLPYVFSEIIFAHCYFARLNLRKLGPL